MSRTPKPQPIVTKESLKQMLLQATEQKRIDIIGRALMVLLRNQTEDEQEIGATVEHNGEGFTGTDAELGTKTAKYYQQHKTLGEWAVEAWMKPNSTGYPRICKYHNQLNNAAMQKVS